MQHPRRAKLFLSLALASLAACGPLIKPSDVTQNMYTLNTPRSLPKSQKATAILVEAPAAPGNLDTAKIALRKENNRFDYFAESQWVDRAPLMIHHLAVKTMEHSGNLTISSTTPSGTETEYALSLEIRDFQAEYADAGAPAVHVTLAARLQTLPDRRLVAARVFEQSVKAEANAMQDVVKAFDAALQQALSELSPWALKQIN